MRLESSEPRAMPLCSPERVAGIYAHEQTKNGDNFDEEPSPTSTGLSSTLAGAVEVLVRASVRIIRGRLRSRRVGFIKILRFQANDVVILGQFAGFGTESQVSHRRNCNRRHFETLRPLGSVLVLQFQFQVRVLIIREPCLGRPGILGVTPNPLSLSKCTGQRLVQLEKG